MRFAVAGWTAALILGAAVAAQPTGSQPAEETVFRIPKGQDAFFRNYWVTGSAYLQFHRNGAYRVIDREHMGVWEFDRGNWTQADSGEITLIPLRVKEIFF